VAIRIEQLTPEHIPAARNVIRAGCLEFFGGEPAAFEDMDAPFVEYGPPSGTFLVLLDDDAVVGTGAIRRLEDEVCELKRMWFLPAYRGKGYGWQMSERLTRLRAVGWVRSHATGQRASAHGRGTTLRAAGVSAGWPLQLRTWLDLPREGSAGVRLRHRANRSREARETQWVQVMPGHMTHSDLNAAGRPARLQRFNRD
jgi:GNAT superfamily N-acetyltransferase